MSSLTVELAPLPLWGHALSRHMFRAPALRTPPGRPTRGSQRRQRSRPTRKGRHLSRAIQTLRIPRGLERRGRRLLALSSGPGFQ
ncbi:hypothetical protein DACRYDRAFT_93047 [Dacryopinax primogenitus]|uniref:Uncharacterized protein n=1 Tax=Dacryopinax primogenitus (strain DJM 731) TaxID=1858805 RepID=M5GAL6_DACPD|nr:uncharacterized protein DACRYDRAFT_93047 [Dacryopinax primogenitus]EJU05904.1 hypothetical protein DACRYDRAFT_93047 [Dacryopinax primogenitus]